MPEQDSIEVSEGGKTVLRPLERRILRKLVGTPRVEQRVGHGSLDVQVRLGLRKSPQPLPE
jgi:hypothetical protein